MYVCMCLYVPVCVYLHICLFMFVYVFLYLCIHVYVSSGCVWVYVSVCACIHVSAYVYISHALSFFFPFFYSLGLWILVSDNHQFGLSPGVDFNPLDKEVVFPQDFDLFCGASYWDPFLKCHFPAYSRGKGVGCAFL